MQTMLLKVLKCGELFSVKSEKSEGGQLSKRSLVLQELGGKYENCYAVSALGAQAEVELKEGDLVFVTMRSDACGLAVGERQGDHPLQLERRRHDRGRSGLLRQGADGIRYAQGRARANTRGPRNLLALLPDEFTLEDAIRMRLSNGKDREGAENMLNQWVFRGYVLRITDYSFKKLMYKHEQS